MSIKVIGWVLEHSTVQHRGDLLVLLVLGDHAHDDGAGAYPGVETIGAKARLTRRGAQLALRRLEQCGAIARVGVGPRGTVEYRVVMGEVSSPREVSSRRSERHRGAKSVTSIVSLTSPEPSVNRQRTTTPQPPSRRGARGVVRFSEPGAYAEGRTS